MAGSWLDRGWVVAGSWLGRGWVGAGSGLSKYLRQRISVCKLNTRPGNFGEIYQGNWGIIREI